MILNPEFVDQLGVIKINSGSTLFASTQSEGNEELKHLYKEGEDQTRNSGCRDTLDKI
jgi:hypothetical protein